MTTKVRIRDNGYGGKDVIAFVTETPDQVAAFAMDLIKMHANVAAKDDGEDSQGRARLALQTPEELVARSFKIAQLAFDTARERGLMVELPDLNEVNRERDERVAAKEAAVKEAAQRA
jgi:hypothetical protein